MEQTPIHPKSANLKKNYAGIVGKKGHIQRVCQSKQRGKPRNTSYPTRSRNVHVVESERDEWEDVLGSLEVHNINKVTSDIIWVNLKVEKKPLDMELDTGSAVSIIPYELYQKRFSDKNLEKATILLKTYTGERIAPVGVLKMNVEYKQQKFLLDLYVVKTKGPVLMGRDWLNRIRLDWTTIKSLRVGGANPSNPDVELRLKNLLNQYADIFEDKLGTLKSAKAKLILKEGSQPRFCKARQVPYALKPKVEEELRRLQKEGILSKAD